MSESTVQEREAMAGVVRLLRRVRERVQRERGEKTRAATAPTVHGPADAAPTAFSSFESHPAFTDVQSQSCVHLYNNPESTQAQKITPVCEGEVLE
jgi:ATP-dependent helicase YprA (DUF1998 family)